MTGERYLQDYIGRRLAELGWEVVEWGPGEVGERDSLEEVLLKNRLFEAIERINGVILTEEEREELLSRLETLPNSIEGIKRFLDFVRNGIPLVLRREEGSRTEEIPKQIFLFDTENPENNDFLAVREFEVEERARRRFDFCLFVNGIPLAVVETKNPFAEEEKTTWHDAYKDLLIYEKDVPSVFRFVQFCIATDGYTTKYFPNYYAKDYSDSLSVWESFYPFEEEDVRPSKLFRTLDSTIFGMLSKQNLIDLVENFIFVKRVRDTYVKVIARWMQFSAANKIVRRVVEGEKKRGLIWHWQGSGKTLTMAFASWKLFRHRKLEQPSIFIIVDRRDLQRQLRDEFLSIGIEVEVVSSIKELAEILKWGGREREGKRGIFVCLIQKFKPEKLKAELEACGISNIERENVIILTDESHRSQYGILAITMRNIFKNAFIFGFTGTPLSKVNRNTFREFSPTGELYMDRFGIFDSINSGFTLPIRYEARHPEMHLSPEELELLARYEEEVLDELSEEEREIWRRRVRPKLDALKSEDAVRKVCEDIAKYFKGRIEETPLKAMVATVDRECGVLFKRELDRLLGEGLCEIVMSYQAKEKLNPIEEYKRELRERFRKQNFEEINDEIIRRFREEELPRILIVSDMLLTGFDAKNLWVLFLYKPLKEHRLLQAIARTNRPYPGKEFGLIVDYLGLARYLERALQHFELDFAKEVRACVRKLEASEEEFEKTILKLKKMFEELGVEVGSVEDVEAAVESLILNEKEVEFTEEVKKLRNLYELLSPSDVVFKHLEFYKAVISVAVALSRYRRAGLRLEEIESAANKTRKLIRETVSVQKVEEVGVLNIDEELKKLEAKRPLHALRVIAEISDQISGKKGEFYVSVKKELEAIIKEMRERKAVTKEVIERIRRVWGRLKEREKEKEELGELFPIFDVLRQYFPSDHEKLKNASKHILDRLKKKKLLSRESFLKGTQRKKIRRVVRENLIRHFEHSSKIDRAEEEIFLNLEGEYG